MPSGQKVIVFIDAQNVYHGARNAFFNRADYHVHGQFDPLALGELLTQRGKPGTSRTLQEVRIYTGKPDATKSPKAYSAHMRQTSGWQAKGVTVIARPLRYPKNWPHEKEQEKGIDVLLAIDFCTLSDRYDTGIMFSTDTDLSPALEYVVKSQQFKKVEVAGWRSGRQRLRLGVPGSSVWCHWLSRADYNQVADTKDYNV